MYGTLDAARIYPPLTWIAEPIEVVIDPAVITATIRTPRPGHDPHTMTVPIPGPVAYPDPARHAIADLDLRSTEAWINENAHSWLDTARPGRNRPPLPAHLEFDTTTDTRRIRVVRTSRSDTFHIHRASDPAGPGMVTRSLRAAKLHQLLGVLDLAAGLPDYQVDRDPDMTEFAPIGDIFPLGTRITTARRIDQGDVLLGIPAENTDEGIRIKPLSEPTRVHHVGRFVSSAVTEVELTIDGQRGTRVPITANPNSPFAVSHVL